jgi:hypothetical protein
MTHHENPTPNSPAESIANTSDQHTPRLIAEAYFADDSESDDTYHNTELWWRLGGITLVALVCLYGGFQFWMHSPLNTKEGILAEKDPVQVMLPQPQRMKYKTAWVDKVAQYHITARVLHTASSWMDPAAAISPMDVGLGWGDFSDKKVVNEFEIGQTDRHLFITPKSLSAYKAVERLGSKLANVHTIPANAQVAQQLGWLRPGQVIEAKGYLVNLHLPTGQTFQTSLSRTDVGDGACEIMLIESLKVVQ